MADYYLSVTSNHDIGANMIDLKSLQDIVGNAPTAKALRDLGLDLLPVSPDGDLDGKVLKAYMDAGKPTGRFFEGHKLVTPDTWEAMRRAPEMAASDPIDGHKQTPGEAAAWLALAPVKLPHGKGTVPMVLLLAYGAAEGELNPDVTSTIARLMLPKGTEPIDPPELLGEVALAWTFDPRAADIAKQRLAPHVQVPVPPLAAPRRLRDGSPAQMIVNNGPVGAQVNVIGASRESKMADLFSTVFDDHGLRSFMYNLPNGRQLDASLPGRGVSMSQLANEAALLLHRTGRIDAQLFTALLAARPRWANEIDRLRDLYGV